MDAVLALASDCNEAMERLFMVCYVSDLLLRELPGRHLSAQYYTGAANIYAGHGEST